MVQSSAGYSDECELRFSRLQESDLSPEQISKLKGTGKAGMLTKGDVLVALGKLKNPYGSAEKLNTDILGPSGKRASEVSDLAQFSTRVSLEVGC
jgi:hypothetical protein